MAVSIALGFTGEGQEVMRDNVIGGLRLHLVPDSIGLAYVEARDFAVSDWFFVGEPIQADLFLGNTASQSLILPRQPREWFETVVLEVTAIDPSPDRIPHARSVPRVATSNGVRKNVLGRSRRSANAEVRAAEVLLGRNRSDAVAFEIVGRDGTGLSPGVYVLSGFLDSRYLPLSARLSGNVLEAQRVLGVRDVTSQDDLMDQAAHMAVRALRGGRYGRAREWYTRLLQLNPSSIVAMAGLGNVAEREGRCGEAQNSWRRAASIAATNGDPDLKRPESFSREAAADFNKRIERCK